MSFLSRKFIKLGGISPCKIESIISTARLAKTKVDPFVEKKNKTREENLNPLLKETFGKRFRKFVLREVIPMLIALGSTGYMIYLIINKKKESMDLDEMSRDKIYRDKDILNSQENTGFFNVSKFLKLQTFSKYPYHFFQLVNFNVEDKSENSQKETHVHFYKLNQYLKRENIDLKVEYLNIFGLNEHQQKKLSEIFGIDMNNLKKSNYVVSNSEGEFLVYSDNFKEKNFDFVKNFLIGIPYINSLEELKDMIYNLTEETVTIIADGFNQNDVSSRLLNLFFLENSTKFNNNTFNLLKSKIGNNKFTIKEDQLIVILNKNIYSINKDYLEEFVKNFENNSFFEYEIIIEKYFPSIDKFCKLNESITEEEKIKFLDSSNYKYVLLSQEKLGKIKDKYDLEDDYYYVLKIKPINKNKFEEYYLTLSKILKNFINIDFSNENQELKLKKIKDESRQINKIFHRINYTDNMEIGIYNKIKYFTNRDKFLIIYLNNYNLYSLIDPDITKIKQDINEIIVNLSREFPYLKLLVTSNPMIFNLFNLIPSERENISVRFFDYSKYIKYNDDLSGEYSILNINKENNLNEIIKEMNKNLIFNYKTNFSDVKMQFNLENLKDFIRESNNNQILPHLESVDLVNKREEIVTTKVKNINSNDLNEKIFNETSAKSLILLINNECVGCKSIEYILNEFLEDEKIENKFKVYKYNTMNENYKFKKFRNVPSIVIFDNQNIVEEIDMKGIIENNQNHDLAIKEFLEKILRND